MKKCPFIKKIYDRCGAKEEEFEYCETDSCMAYDEDNQTCKLIELKINPGHI